jgi:hypothetical protein
MDVFELHGLWHAQRRCGESAVMPALSAFKSLRNFVKLLVASREQPAVGVDWNTLAAEPLSDCVMYMCSVLRASGHRSLPRVEYVKQLSSVEVGVARWASTLSEVLLDAACGEVSLFDVQVVLEAVHSLAACCAVDMDAAVAAALKKLESKR